MRVAKTWDQFKALLDEAFPRQDETVRLPWFQNQPLQSTPTLPRASVTTSIEPLPLFARLSDVPPESEPQPEPSLP
jgi:hypothetical protein